VANQRRDLHGYVDPIASQFKNTCAILMRNGACAISAGRVEGCAMVDEPAVVDPIQAGCAAGRRARAEDAAVGLEPPARSVLLMRAAIACAALVDRLPGPPLHDAAIARERFIWAYVLGYTEGPAAARPETQQPAAPPTVRRARRAAARRAAIRTRPAVRIPPTRRRRTGPNRMLSIRYSGRR
jgi:hypothetical protein